MCTLVFGIDVPAPGAILIAANRDENPGRPSDPPRLLHAQPRVVGGRDRRAGGTWLAVRDRKAAVAMLNRRAAPGAPPTRSRGLLALEVASSRDALEAARAALGRDVYAPFSLVHLAPGACWILVHGPDGPDAVLHPGPGWHVLTHADLDDPDEPRTAALLESLDDWRPADWNEARAGLAARMAGHGPDPARAVCVHDAPMATVSSAILRLGGGATRWLHAEGRPCERPFEDQAGLLDEGGAGRGEGG